LCTRFLRNESIYIHQTYTKGTPYKVLGLIRFWRSQVKGQDHEDKYG